MVVEATLFEQSDWVANNQRLPVLRYNLANGEDFEALFAKNKLSGIWTNGVFDYRHYHTDAREVLGVKNGLTTLLIGGPGGREFKVSRGDCLILPAGTGHLVIADDGDGFDKAQAHPGMGTRLMRGVVGQLHGEFFHEGRNGTVFTAELEIIDHLNEADGQAS
jgi:uncharacterized protein YjlB